MANTSKPYFIKIATTKLKIKSSSKSSSKVQLCHLWQFHSLYNPWALCFIPLNTPWVEGRLTCPWSPGEAHHGRENDRALQFCNGQKIFSGTRILWVHKAEERPPPQLLGHNLAPGNRLTLGSKCSATPTRPSLWLSPRYIHGLFEHFLIK